jgi:hypothetical protein
MNTTIITSRDNENDYYQEVIGKSYMLTDGRQKQTRQRLTHITKIENQESYKDNLGNIYENFDDIPEGLHSLIIHDGNDENEAINKKLAKFKEGDPSSTKLNGIGLSMVS